MFESSRSELITRDFADIKIRGSAEFCDQVERALELLQEKSPKTLDFVRTHIGIIQEARRSGMVPQNDPPRFNLSLKSSEYSPTWTASVIAHDAVHSALLLEYRSSWGEPVPDEVWCGVEAEKKALEYQGQVLEQLDAPDWERDYLKGLDGTHGNFGGVLSRFRDIWKFLKRDW